MYNAYPGAGGGEGRSETLRRLDEFVYRRTAEVLQVGGGSVIFDPESLAAQAIQNRTQAMVDTGMDPYRVAVISSKAQIDASDGLYLRREAALEDIRDH